MLKYILGISGIIVGFLLVWKSSWLLNNFGRVDFAEKYLVSFGGTRMFYKFVGIIIILICFIWITGTLGDIILAIFGPLFGGPPQ